MPEIEPAPEKAQPLLRLLVEAIERGRFRQGQPETFLSYSEALGYLGRPKPWFRSGSRLQKVGLDALNEWTIAHPELPKIAALIVNKGSHRPSPGFAESHGQRTDTPEWEIWWISEANRAIRFHWNPFLLPITRYRRVEEPSELSVHEEGESELPDYRAIITVEPAKRSGRPCIRGMRITVGDILGWLAMGRSERQIIEEFPELTQQDIRASLAYAADREQQASNAKLEPSRLSAIASQWREKLILPKSDPDDPRMDYLLRKYWRNRE